MNHAGNRRKINGTMQYTPAPPAETPNPACRRSSGQWNQEQKTEKPYCDERSLGDIFPHGTQIERLIGAKIGEEVQADVEKGEEAEHATETDEIRKVEDLAKRRDAQGENQKTQSPPAGGELNELGGIGAEAVMKGAPGEPAKRNQANEEEDNLGPLAGKESTHARMPAQKFFFRSMPLYMLATRSP